MSTWGYTDHVLYVSSAPLTCQDRIELNVGVYAAMSQKTEDWAAAGDDPYAQCVALQTYYQAIDAVHCPWNE